MTYIEQNCVISHEGRTFEASGAIVSPHYIIAYPGKNGVLNDWHGNALGTWRTVAKWPIRSWVATHMRQIEARVNGVTYTGRGFGEGCIFRGKRKAV